MKKFLPVLFTGLSLAWTSVAFAQTSVPVFSSNELGNIFSVDQTPQISVSLSASKVTWTVYDFWHKEVSSGETAVSGGIAHIEPKVTKPGYYLLRIVPDQSSTDAYTSFAIIRPHPVADPVSNPFGAMTHFAQGMNPEILPLLKKIGIASIRDEHYWAHVEMEKGVYQFPGTSDAYMEACKKNGIIPLVAMTFGNGLYDTKEGPTTPEGFQGYANYGESILKKYGDEIHWLEIWNEYNGTWAPLSAKKDLKSRYTTYTGMLEAAYSKIKQVRPDVQVLGGAAVLIPLPYFEGIFKLGGLKYMDAVVIHPYRATPEGVDSEVAELQQLIKKYNNGEEKPVWVTETGRYTKDEYEWEKGRKMFEMGRAEGARYLARQYTLLLKQHVAKIYWYLACDHATFVSMGLLRHHQNEASGMGRLAVAPSYVAYSTLINQLDGAKFVERQGVRDYTRAHVEFFKRGDEEIRVCWSTQPSKMIFKTTRPLTVVDLMGGETTSSPVNGAVTLDLGLDTVYVKGPVQGVTEADSGRRIIGGSVDDYTKTQGVNNWRYGYLEGDGPFSTTEFKELSQVETMWGYEWGGAGRYLKVSDLTMHPDMNDHKPMSAAKRWTSPITGKVRLETTWTRDGNGDGILAKILIDGKEILSQPVGGVSPKKFTAEPVVEVKSGTIIDFLVHPNQSTDFDATLMQVIISQEN